MVAYIEIILYNVYEELIYMKLDITGIGIDVTDGIREYATKKVAKLDKFFDNSTIAHVTFSAKKEKQNVNIRIESKGKTYMAEENIHDVYAGIDLIIDKLLGQIRKQKTIKLNRRTASTVQMGVTEEDLEAEE